MDKLQELITKLSNDSSWNTENKDGTHRFDEKLRWIEKMVKDYADKLGVTTDEVVEILESKRTYSWPNYYQEANFPGIDSSQLYGVFDSFEEFHGYASEHWTGFRCPRCGMVSPHPQECKHRMMKDGVCDWHAAGLFRSGRGVIIKEDGLALIPIFEPIPPERVKRIQGGVSNGTIFFPLYSGRNGPAQSRPFRCCSLEASP